MERKKKERELDVRIIWCSDLIHFGIGNEKELSLSPSFFSLLPSFLSLLPLFISDQRERERKEMMENERVKPIPMKVY